MTIEARIKQTALDAGFMLCGIGSADAPSTQGFYERWVEAGFGEPMDYLRRHVPLKSSLESVLPGAQSVIAVALNYHQPNPVVKGQPRIAQYALGRDYHKVIPARLRSVVSLLDGYENRICVDSAPVLERELAQRAGLGWPGKNTMLINTRRGSWFLLGFVLTTARLVPDEPAVGGCGSCRACIDACPTGAIQWWEGQASDANPSGEGGGGNESRRGAEAEEGYNSSPCLQGEESQASPSPGSQEKVSSVSETDEVDSTIDPHPVPFGHRPLPASQGEVSPLLPMLAGGGVEHSETEGVSPSRAGRGETRGRWIVDARLCLSTLTIETKGPLPGGTDLHGWTFGCDICQEVCPFNQERASQPGRAPITQVEDFSYKRPWPSLVQLAHISSEEWDELTRGSPVRRTGHQGLIRNAKAGL